VAVLTYASMLLEFVQADLSLTGSGACDAPDPKAPTRATRWRKKGVWWLMWFCLCCAGLPSSLAEISKEYQLKAVLLWRLGQFTEWPPDAFATPDSPLVIGVLGHNPFGDALALAVRGETAHGRNIVIRYYRQVREIKTCHILYMDESDDRRVTEIIAELGHRSILTVGASDGFARSSGGMVQFVTESNKIKLRLNLAALAAARLVLDARVLRAADVVGAK
jgi:hypothetical protein